MSLLMCHHNGFPASLGGAVCCLWWLQRHRRAPFSKCRSEIDLWSCSWIEAHYNLSCQRVSTAVCCCHSEMRWPIGFPYVSKVQKIIFFICRTAYLHPPCCMYIRRRRVPVNRALMCQRTAIGHHGSECRSVSTERDGPLSPMLAGRRYKLGNTNSDGQQLCHGLPSAPCQSVVAWLDLSMLILPLFRRFNHCSQDSTSTPHPAACPVFFCTVI